MTSPTILSEPKELQIVKQAAKRARIVEHCAPPRNATKGTILICVVRNEMNRLPAFLAHHRRLGFERFVFIDNGSSDGTLEYLLRQCDTGVFATNDTFHWTAKHGWIMQVIERLGQERWYALLDADEHLVFANCESRTIHEFVSGLQARGLRRARGCLVDMYSDKPVFDTARHDEDFSASYPYFDASGYSEHRSGRLTERTGGPRKRMAESLGYANAPALTKYPVFQLNKDEVAYNPHLIWPPFEAAEDPCWLALKHYKFDAALAKKMDYAIETGVYWNDSSEYALYKEWRDQNPTQTLHHAHSEYFNSSQDLLACGLIEGMEELLSEPSIQSKIAKARSLGRANQHEAR